VPMLFVTLPVRDLSAARAFYEALGFRINQHSSDKRTAAVVVDDTIVVKLMTREAFGELTAGEVGDPAEVTTVINCLTMSDRALVDEVVATALASGGMPWLPARDDETTYTGSFTDPDGHVWQLMWMDQLHVVN
jgi:predicted lactoylglutathione lyase